MTAASWHLFGGGVVVFALVLSGLLWLARRNRQRSLRFDPPPPPCRRIRSSSARRKPRSRQPKRRRAAK